MLDLQVWHIVLTVLVLLFLGAFVGGRIAIIRSLTQAGDGSRPDVTELLEEAGQAVADRPPEAWASQITYLLKALDDKCGDAEYRRMLEAVCNAITARLAQGRW